MPDPPAARRSRGRTRSRDTGRRPSPPGRRGRPPRANIPRAVHSSPNANSSFSTCATATRTPGEVEGAELPLGHLGQRADAVVDVVHPRPHLRPCRRAEYRRARPASGYRLRRRCRAEGGHAGDRGPQALRQGDRPEHGEDRERREQRPRDRQADHHRHVPFEPLEVPLGERDAGRLGLGAHVADPERDDQRRERERRPRAGAPARRATSRGSRTGSRPPRGPGPSPGTPRRGSPRRGAWPPRRPGCRTVRRGSAGAPRRGTDPAAGARPPRRWSPARAASGARVGTRPGRRRRGRAGTAR